MNNMVDIADDSRRKATSVVTNADHIRSMTDEELADTFEMREFFAVAYNGTYTERHRPALEWLKQPYKEVSK